METYENIDGTPNNKFYAFTIGPSKSQNGTDVSAASTYNLNQSYLVYPNPAKNEVQILSGNKSNITRIQLYDLTGKLIKETHTPESPQYRLDVRAIPAGSYIIHITTSTGNISQKVVVTH